MEYAENQGRKIGYFVFAALFIVIALYSLFTWQIGTLYACSSLFWVFFAAEAYAKYRFARKRTYLLTAVFAGVASVCFLASFIVTTIAAG
jgi:hypothetical protein